MINNDQSTLLLYCCEDVKSHRSGGDTVPLITNDCISTSELYIFDIWNDNLQSFNREKNEASVPVFYADWTSVPIPRTSSSRGLDVGFIPLLPKELPYMANDEYTDEYDDEYLCRDFFVGFNFWSRLSFQISEFRVH